MWINLENILQGERGQSQERQKERWMCRAGKQDVCGLGTMANNLGLSFGVIKTF